MLAYKARQRRGYGPLIIGMAAATVTVVGKFYLDEEYFGYAGIFLLVAASAWNAWPRQGATGEKAIQPKPFDKTKHQSDEEV